ncbi:MAG: hypothetical protein Q8O57_11305 [Kiritimatiellota bacterium]|nr:hypothetical protein [Kiritimatiellota bacterium]
MEIHLTLDTARRYLFGGLIAFALLMALVLGRSVTPVQDDRPQVLTAERWQAASLARKANAEISQLLSDGQTLRALALQEQPDPIQAMTFAQRIYAAHYNGTAATGPARQNLIAAAEAVARYSSGAISREAAVSAVNIALARIQILAPTPKPSEPPGALPSDS